MNPFRDPLTQEVARLEWKLLFRNRAARFTVILGPAFMVVTILPALLLPDDIVGGGMVVYFVSCVASMSYASLAFSWKVTDWAALFYIPVTPAARLYGRVLVAIEMTAAPFVIGGLVVLWLAPDMIPILLSGTAYGLACVVPLLVVSLRHGMSLDADSAPFADVRRFTWPQWIACAVVLAPGVLLADVLSPATFAVVLAILAAATTVLVVATLGRLEAQIEIVLPNLSERLRGELRDATP